MKVDFSNVPDAPSFEPIPKGDYVLTITEGEMKESGEKAKHPGTPYINWELTVVSDTKGDTTYAGRKIFSITSLHADALAYGLKPMLEATGKYDTAGNLDFEIADLLNLQINCKVKIRKSDEYDDKNEIATYYKPGEGSKATGAKSMLP